MRVTRMLASITAAVATGLAGCGSVGAEGSGAQGESADQALKVGLVIPQSGVYAPLGKDMEAGWELYLQQHGGKLGGRRVETVVADEGEGPDTGVPAVQKLLQGDADVLVGIVNSATALGVADSVGAAKKTVMIANAGAQDITPLNPYIWRSSFTNRQVAFAIGEHLAGTPDGKRGAYAMAADYAAGEEAVDGFKQGFTGAGGKLVGEQLTPFGTTEDFQPFLSEVRRSGAGATFAFYGGSDAVPFVKQYEEFGLSSSVPLYGSGFLTEGGPLEAQGVAALGVKTSLMYATPLDNPANRAFAAAYQQQAGRPATTYAVQTFDAALVLDKAIGAAGSSAGDAVGKALGELGVVAESPRGPWRFEDQSPKQTMYLREVVKDGATVANRIVMPLGEFAPNPGG